MISLLRPRLSSDQRGSVAVEFAILGPFFIALLLGVFQVALGMQSYNAVRQLAADVARDTVIEYQAENDPTRAQIRQLILDSADDVPYLLEPSAMTVAVTQPGTQRVTDAIEYQVAITYQIPSVITLFDWASPSFTYTRPLFVIDNS